MGFKEEILSFTKQSSWEPKIEGKVSLRGVSYFILVGMGGSHLAGDILRDYFGVWNLIVHTDYGLPSLPENILKKSLIVLSSYSGNTEEVITGFHKAWQEKRKMVVITKGGKLLELAREHRVPYVLLPDYGLQPRMALVLSCKALLRVLQKEEELRVFKRLGKVLKPESLEKRGREIAERVQGKVPIIYVSGENRTLGYIWKIKLNETGKTPAFYNFFPELNHNEMMGFDVKGKTRKFTKVFSFLFLEDPEDPPKIKLRMRITKKLLRQRGFDVFSVRLRGEDRIYRVFSGILLADWISFYLASFYERNPSEVPLIEEFKKILRSHASS